MTKRKIERFLFINQETGEEYDAVVVKRFQIGGRWMRAWQDGKEHMLKRIDSPLGFPHMRGQSYKVLAYLDCVVTWENHISTPSGLAKRYGFSETSVYRAYAELIKAGFVIKKDREYFLSPLYCWKGNQAQYREACRTLLPPTSVLLNPPEASKVEAR